MEENVNETVENLDEHIKMLAKLDTEILIKYILLLENHINKAIKFIESEMIIYNGSDQLLEILRGDLDEW